MRVAALVLAAALCAASAGKKVVFPPGAKPVGPYSPGILAGDFLYVSGQGGPTPAGALENVKTIVEAAGLTLEHVVYTQVYLADIVRNGETAEAVSRYFGNTPPAGAVLGVYRMPTDTPVEINAVAVRDLASKKAVGSRRADGFAPGVLAGGRLFISGCTGGTAEAALERFGQVLAAAGLDFRHVVFVNPYLTRGVNMVAMNRTYANFFEFGNTPARATIQVNALPEGAVIQFTGVAVADLAARRAVRPRRCRPAPPRVPVFSPATRSIAPPRRDSFRGRTEASGRRRWRTRCGRPCATCSTGWKRRGWTSPTWWRATSTSTRWTNSRAMNAVYGKYFGGAPPARTTVAPRPPVERKPDAEGAPAQAGRDFGDRGSK